MSTLKIERVNAQSAARMAEIHQACFDKPWSTIEFSALLHLSNVAGLILQRQGKPSGLALIRAAIDEAEILTICVHPDGRKKGAGRALLEMTESEASHLGARRLFLEVSVKNSAARALYDRAGYSEIGRRSAYYADGTDALVLEKALCKDGQNPA